MIEFCEILLSGDLTVEQVEEDGFKQFESLSKLAPLVIVYFYTSGHYLTKNIPKAKEYLEKLDQSYDFLDELASLADYLYIRGH